MGYDFIFMPMPYSGNSDFPIKYSEVAKANQAEKVVPWPAFKDWLCTQGGRRNGENSICVSYEEQSTINFAGSSSSIFLDTHARWKHVFEAFRILESLEQDVCIFDCQDGTYHDEQSFREFMKSNGQKP